MYFLQQIKAKWKEMKMKAKQKVSHNKREMSKTGGGVASILDLTEVDMLVETTIGKASLYGVGGMDTLAGAVDSSITSLHYGFRLYFLCNNLKIFMHFQI